MPPQNGENPYDFITQTSHRPKRGVLPQGNSPKQRGIYAAVIGFALLVLGVIFFVIMSSGGSSMQPMIELAQTQNEIIRITDAASREIKSSDVAEFSQNTNIALRSDQQQTIAYITKTEKAPNAKVLAFKQSSSTDAKLKEATAAGQYDQVYQGILYNQLKAYQSEVESTYKTASGAQQKALLQKLYNSVTTLLKNQTPPATTR